jgi:hypothetical protein
MQRHGKVAYHLDEESPDTVFTHPMWEDITQCNLKTSNEVV